MKVNVFIQRENKNHELNVNSIKDIFSKLNINENEVIIIKNDEIITTNSKLNDNDKIELLSVISGG
ncbi:MAG: MoaD/ThiS family protein [Candidatus Nanoarchaeia archaeon]|jgi:sulfur carrier protein ThiS|nr:MoaD/ThiS family protein [Candidatus Nanoarchaeia archaeon]|tara:strand:+ start:6278 stop:6475 length:198 start_codon:yes stop_codon:yes gene_type:complete